ncbi:hypothetical protein GALL_237070 [mine drainage metagenome]|uniref:GmrSD restriction endonucleases C-terminal domain-containing protein n=1 Tax=mine drainage metagenome TaxID=410659 RepID=A0A1J5RF28_9ZZZZ
MIGCLDTIESFLVRRAICGIEPTGLLGLFRTMWSSVDGHPTAEAIESVIMKRLTIEWPTDERMRESIKTRPLYGAAIAKYVVLEYDKSLGLDQPKTNDFSIEHVMPRSYCDAWSEVVTKPQHAKLKDLWANLIPLSTAMNEVVAQSEFHNKKTYFEVDSMFASARRVGKDFESWGEKEICERSEHLADWAIKRWKRTTNA